RYVMPKEDAKAPNKGDTGWVIELRGYTFHKDGVPFVQNVLMENIARRAAEKAPTWPLVLESVKAAAAAPANPGACGTTPPAAAGNKSISHIILYDSATKKADASTPFEVIPSSKLDRLLAPAPPAKPDKPGGGVPPGGGGVPPGGGGVPPGGGNPTGGNVPP